MNHTITVEKIINGGKGLARLDDGMIVMVPFVLPGETVEVVEKKRFSGYLEVEMLHLLASSSQRREPDCQLYGDCGGCDLQHCSYSMQQQIKEEIFQESLWRSGIFYSEDACQSLVPAQFPFSYRYRIRMKFSRHSGPGFFKVRSNTVVPVEFCPVATARINRVLKELHTNWETMRPLAETCSEIELLHSPADAKMIGFVHLQKNRKPDWRYLHRLAELESLDDLLVRAGNHIMPVIRDRKQQVLSQEFQNNKYVRHYTLFWGAGCFSQVNAVQNEKLLELVCQLCGPMAGKRVIDLYCGVGNFTIPLALLGAVGTGVEQSQQSLHWASVNMTAAGIDSDRWDFFCGDVGKILSRLQKNKKEFDCIVCDPPRTGLGKNAGLLASFGAERIVYVSCDPATLARDLKTLSSSGYQVTFLAPVDMFPQTHHLESVALLEKN